MERVLKSYLEYFCGKENVFEFELMKNHTTIKIGGVARFFVNVKTKEILLKIISAVKFIEYPYIVVGGGSNLLVSDDGFDGLVLKPVFSEIVENGNIIYADAGASLAALAKRAQNLSLAGLEFACQIPGSVGGAVYGNAGAFSRCIADVAVMIDALDENANIVTIENSECNFGYRTSIFKSKKYIILGAYFCLVKGNEKEIERKTYEYKMRRGKTQPTGNSMGSIFKNPDAITAGKIIDRAGLKGARIGGAMVSYDHANIIINESNASANDILQLIEYIKKTVYDKFQINLECEIEII